MANPLELCTCQQAGLSQAKMLTVAETACSAEPGSSRMTPLLGMFLSMGTGSLVEWVQLRWLGGGFQIWVLEGHCNPLLRAWGRVFKVTRSLDWAPNLGSCHLDDTVTGDLGKQTSPMKMFCLHLLACLDHLCTDRFFN